MVVLHDLLGLDVSEFAGLSILWSRKLPHVEEERVGELFKDSIVCNTMHVLPLLYVVNGALSSWQGSIQTIHTQHIRGYDIDHQRP